MPELLENNLEKSQEYTKSWDMIKVTEQGQDHTDIEKEGPTDDEKKMATYVKNRFLDMDAARPTQSWSQYQKQFEAVVSTNTDGSASINRPIEFTVCEMKESDMGEERPVIKFIPIGPDDIKKLPALEAVWDYWWIKARISTYLRLHRLGVYIFGTGVTYVGAEIDTKIIEDIENINDDGSYEYKRKLIKTLNIGVRPVDIRKFWVDNRAKTWNDAIDCIEEEFLPIEEFVLKYGFSPLYKYVKCVELACSSVDEQRIFSTAEERVKGSANSKMVRLLHYWNKTFDKYIVTHYDTDTPIRISPIPYADKKLPYTLQQDHLNYRSIYGRGECEILASTKSEMNTTREIYIDGMKQANEPIVLMNGGMQFDGAEPVWDRGTVWKFSGSGDIKEFKSTGPDASLINYLGILNDDVVMDTGMNPRETLDTSRQTAFEAGLKEQSKQKRIKVSLRLQDDFLQSMAELLLSRIQQFFPVTALKQILEINDDGTATPIEKFNTNTIPLPDKKVKEGPNGVKIEEAKGEIGFLNVTPESIRGSYDVLVETTANKALLREVDKTRIQEMVQAIAQLAPLKPEMLQDIDTTQLTKIIFKTFDKDPDELKAKKNGNEEALGAIKQALSMMPGPFQTNRSARAIKNSSPLNANIPT